MTGKHIYQVNFHWLFSLTTSEAIRLIRNTSSFAGIATAIHNFWKPRRCSAMSMAAITALLIARMKNSWQR